MYMADSKTRSAHCQSSSVRRLVLRSARRSSHSAGSKAATVSKPKGGLTVLLPMSRQDFWKLQKEGGNSGQINKARIAVNLLTNRRSPATRRWLINSVV